MDEMKLINSDCLTATNAVRSAAIIAVLVSRLSVARGEDLTTLDGKTYTNITEFAKYPNQVFFTCNGERIHAAITNLPEEFKSKHEIEIITNAPTVPVSQTQINPTDSFLWQHRGTTLSECDSEFTFSNLDQLAQLDTQNDKSWQICLSGIEVRLTSYKTTKGITSEPFMRFDLGHEGAVNQVFDKFIEWDGAAEKNKAEALEKEIGSLQDSCVPAVGNLHTYTFDRDEFGSDLLFDSGDGGVFNKNDVMHFQNLLKRLPSLKEKLAGRIANQATQQGLFK
jgi:hypothetical protein